MFLLLGEPESWHAEFASPGGPLPFELVVLDTQPRRAYVRNADEQVYFDEVQFDPANQQWLFRFGAYDSEIQAVQAGNQMTGKWVKRTSASTWTSLPFSAQRMLQPRARFAEPNASSVAGSPLAERYRVTFHHVEEGDSSAIFEVYQDQPRLIGTFLTPTGDYRFLEGKHYGNQLFLSCFDGGHAFLFTATQVGDQLQGDFWSSDKWHETWQAEPDAKAQLEDDMGMTHLRRDDPYFPFSFPDLEGNVCSDSDPAFQNKVRVISLFGSWCPNCNDEHRFLSELDQKYRKRGLAIIGIGFEVTGDPERDRQALTKFKKRIGLEYPLLLAGAKDKSLATEVIGNLDRIRAYPTTLFIDRAGKVRAIHSGFSGPGTGSHYRELQNRFTHLIEQLLNEN
ncbi:MAG: TlpA family protein disulfide reductase [Acidobacteria bacterium]|nr:TlpA family protein disulfide reductase [Acidobacteriota bacterium]